LTFLAGLPLIDGVYAGALSGGVFRSLLGALAFGCTCFSGAGCFAVAALLEDGRPARLRAVLRVYAFIAVGAVVGALILPSLAPLLFPGFDTMVAPLVLIGVATALWPRKPPSADQASTESGRESVIGVSWRAAFSRTLCPQGVLAVALICSAIYDLEAVRAGTLDLKVDTPSTAELFGVVLAVAAAALETLVGALLGSVAGSRLPAATLRVGGSLALAAIALELVVGSGIPVFAFLPLGVFTSTVAVGVLLALLGRRTGFLAAG
jgi:hypothetical protein